MKPKEILDERCDQLKYDKSKPPALEKKVESHIVAFDCCRVRCPFNHLAKYCRNIPAWYTCARQIEP